MAKALDAAFIEFKEWIFPSFAQNFTYGNTNFVKIDAFDVFGDKMLTEYEYTLERERFLIEKTKFYFKGIMDRAQSHNTSTDFLAKLSNKIAACFSYYVMYKYEIPESGKSKNKLRMRVQDEIKQALFDNNPYIEQLKQKQAANRAFRKKPKRERTRCIREQHRRDAADAYRSAQQIRGIFNDAQNTPRKKR